MKMLARKQSATQMDISGAAQLMADYGPDETQSEGNDEIWPSLPKSRIVLRTLALLSLISVMLNTPKTFEYYPSLRYDLTHFTLLCATKANCISLDGPLTLWMWRACWFSPQKWWQKSKTGLS